MAKIGGFNIQKLRPFKTLTNPVLLDRIGQELINHVNSFSRMGKFLGCPVIPDALVASTSLLVPALGEGGKVPAIESRLERVPSIVSSAEPVPIVESPTELVSFVESRAEPVPVSDFKTESFRPIRIVSPLFQSKINLGEDSSEENSKELDSIRLLPIIREEDRSQGDELQPDQDEFDLHQLSFGGDDVMKTRYIDAYITQRDRTGNTKNKLNKAYSDHLAAKPIAFLSTFDSDRYFRNASRLAKDVRKKVLKFVADVFVHEPVEPKTGYIYWRMRREEIFCLKFLCVQAVHSNSDMNLLDFLRTLYINAGMAFAINPFSNRFNGLISGLKEVVDELDKTPSYPVVRQDEQAAVAQIKQASTKEIAKRDGEIKALKDDVAAKDAVLVVKDSKIKKLADANQAVTATLQAVVQENTGLKDLVKTLEGQVETLEEVIKTVKDDQAVTSAESALHKSKIEKLEQILRDRDKRDKAQMRNLMKEEFREYFAELEAKAKLEREELEAKAKREKDALAALEVKTKDEKEAMAAAATSIIVPQTGKIQELETEVKALKAKLDESKTQKTSVGSSEASASSTKETEEIKKVQEVQEVQVKSVEKADRSPARVRGTLHATPANSSHEKDVSVQHETPGGEKKAAGFTG